MTLTIQHDADKKVFLTVVDGHQAYIDYELDGSKMIVMHTIVHDTIGGRGIAGELTRAALDTAHANRWAVIPVCSYTQTYIKRHPEYQDLVPS